MASSVIASTRRGFAYQDKYALVVYLRNLLNGRPFSFFVDYPIGAKSLDIRVAFADKDEDVLEVKTGESFKADAVVDEKTEVQMALETLYDYWSKGESARIQLVVSPEFHGKALAHWSALDSIHRTKRLSAKMRRHCEKYRRLLGFAMRRVPLQRFAAFIRKTRFVSEFGDELESGRDRHSPIEDAIISMIQDLATTCGASSASTELTDRDIMCHLLQRMVRHCGTGDDVGPMLLEALADLFSRRQLIADMGSVGNKDAKLAAKRAAVDQALAGLAKSIVPPAPAATATQTPEGKTI